MWKSDITKILRDVGINAQEKDIQIPDNPNFGDFSYPVFNLAKELKKNPIELAKEIVSKIQVTKHPYIIKVEAVNGYVNFFIYWEKCSELIIKKLLNLKKLDFGKREKVMVEFSQPNPVHSMHIGHARGTFIGDSLSRILDFCSYDVLKANYMNDVGLQVAKLVTAYLLWYKGKKPDKKEDYWLWEIYVRFHEEAKKDPSLEEKAREILRKYEIEKDPEIVKIWNKLVRWCVRGFEKTYRRLKINFDVWFYEHDFRDIGKDLIYQSLAKGISFKDESGAIIAKLDNYGLPNTVILRSDGTGLYFTSDLGLTYHKFEKYKLDKAIWVVSSQQSLYLKQLFTFLNLFGFTWAKNCYHCSFEHVNLPEGKMSSREGKAILLDEVLDMLEKKVREEVKKRNSNKDERKIISVSKKISLGAIKYSILKIQPEDQIIFEWEKMLQLEGKTGPYIQYACIRCLGILNKVKKFEEKYVCLNLSDEERSLIKKLNEFTYVVEKCARELKPYYLANYLYELAVVFNNFYEKVPVLKENDIDKRNFRLTLVKTCEKILRTGLSLLGIEVPDFM
ncbi:MAG: arginine--tRNA ligase [Candidatus Aenigmatarchaeota archaeon]